MKGSGSTVVFILASILGSGFAQEPCGYTVNITDGQTTHITSPNFPEQYPNNADCIWKVHATDISSLLVSCPQLDLQWTIFGCVDTLTFSDVENFNQQPSYCGNKKPPATLGFGDSVFMHFKSDNTWTDKGFNCSVTAKKVTEDRNCTCGKANLPAERPRPLRLGKIWNGTPLAKHQYPWLGFIQLPNTSPATVLCGATLISSHYVLTSARCVYGFNPTQIRVRLGEHDLMNENESPPHKVYDVEAVKIHPDFNVTTLSNDLALVRVGEQILFAANIRPACLPEGSLDLGAGTSLTASGWGPTTLNGEQVTIPRQTSLDIDPPTSTECSDRLPEKYAVGEGQFCTTTLTGSDVCIGDFGGPITMVDSTGQNVLAGISSFNTECGNPDKPTVHSRVDVYKPWILAETSDSIKCGPSS